MPARKKTDTLKMVVTLFPQIVIYIYIYKLIKNNTTPITVKQFLKILKKETGKKILVHTVGNAFKRLYTKELLFKCKTPGGDLWSTSKDTIDNYKNNNELEEVTKEISITFVEDPKDELYNDFKEVNTLYMAQDQTFVSTLLLQKQKILDSIKIPMDKVKYIDTLLELYKQHT